MAAGSRLLQFEIVLDLPGGDYRLASTVRFREKIEPGESHLHRAECVFSRETWVAMGSPEHVIMSVRPGREIEP